MEFFTITFPLADATHFRTDVRQRESVQLGWHSVWSLTWGSCITQKQHNDGWGMQVLRGCNITTPQIPPP